MKLSLFGLIGRLQGDRDGVARRRGWVAPILVAAMLLAGADAIAAPFGAAAVAAVSTNFGSAGNPTNIAADPSDVPGQENPAHILSTSLDNGRISAAASTDGTGLIEGASGSASASADLASGTLHVFAETTGAVFVPAVNQAVPLLQSTAQASFEDTLTAQMDGMMHFTIGISGSVPLLVSCANATSGEICIGGMPTPGGFSAVINFVINNAFAVDTNGHVLGVGGEGTGIGCDTPGLCDVQFAVDVPVLIGDTLNFDLTLQVGAAADTADFSHTLMLGVSGVPFTSASGIFLTAAAVPEPETYAMLLAGLGLLGFVARHRTQKAA
jgi:hypothetical protein